MSSKPKHASSSSSRPAGPRVEEPEDDHRRRSQERGASRSSRARSRSRSPPEARKKASRRRSSSRSRSRSRDRERGRSPPPQQRRKGRSRSSSPMEDIDSDRSGDERDDKLRRRDHKKPRMELVVYSPNGKKTSKIPPTPPHSAESAKQKGGEDRDDRAAAAAAMDSEATAAPSAKAQSEEEIKKEKEQMLVVHNKFAAGEVQAFDWDNAAQIKYIELNKVKTSRDEKVDKMKVLMQEGSLLVHGAMTGAMTLPAREMGMAVWAESVGNQRHLFALGIDPEKQFVARLKGIYVNLNSRSKQKFKDLYLQGACYMSPFFVHTQKEYGNYGPTVELGVNGNRGKIIEKEGKKIPVKSGDEKYEISMSNAPYGEFVSDQDTDPFMDRFLSDFVPRLERKILTDVCTLNGQLPEIRKAIQDVCDKYGRPVPKTPGQWADRIIEEGKFQSKVSSEDTRPERMYLGAGIKCFRKLHKRYVNGELRIVEQPDDVPKPSDMFEGANHARPVTNEKGIVTGYEYWVHNAPPAWRMRTPSELAKCKRDPKTGEPLDEKGNPITDPYIRIPDDNVEWTTGTVMALIAAPSFYVVEGKCGVTHKGLGVVIAGHRNDFEKLDPADCVPCNPKYAISGIPKYVGPLDRAAVDNAAYQQQHAYSKEQAAAQRQQDIHKEMSNEDDEEALAAVTAAAEAKAAKAKSQAAEPEPEEQKSQPRADEEPEEEEKKADDELEAEEERRRERATHKKKKKKDHRSHGHAAADEPASQLPDLE